MRKSLSFALILLFLVPAMIVAQGATTGSFSGNVKDVDGNAVAGADIVIVHVPTGTRYMTLSRSIGTYNVPAVRVGGPYTITVSFEGFKTEKKEDLVVRLGETKEVNFTLQLATVDAGEVLVTASTPIINPYRTGASQNVAREAIESLPSISRDLSSFTRLAPQFTSGEDSGSFSAGGRSPRYNNIQIDGAQNNDLFGLGDTGAPGGQTMVTPISLDAIQEFQIVLAPYDVRHGMFTGGGVNVITKSGTNDFHGSAYFYGRNESLIRKGSNAVGSDLIEFPEFKESSYGITFGGPLVRNKLFFFVSGEIKKEKSQKDLDFVIDGSGSPVDYGYKDDAERMANILKTTYGYDPGAYGPVSNDFDSTQLLIKFDWNINRNHNLSLRHNYVDANREILRRNVDYAYSFENWTYLMQSTTNSTVLQLNSTLSSNLFNELIVNYTTIRDKRTPTGDDFPAVQIRGSGLQAGSETYSHKNQLDEDLVEITNNLTLYAGNHTITFGTHNEFFQFFNVFLKRAYGHYYFQNLDDLEAGKAYRYRTTYSNTSDPVAPAEFGVSQLAFYVSDEWNISPTIHLTFGLRADVPLFPDKPDANPAVEAAFGIPTDHVPTGNFLLSPRFGFNIDLGNKKTQLRGGFGIFSGRTPFVWISNQYTVNGVSNTEVYYTNYSGIDFVSDPYNQPQMPGSSGSEISLHDADYKFPQTLRTNIAVDRELPYGFTGTIEFIYSKAINEIMYQNINLKQVGTQQDGRPTYGTLGFGTFWDVDWVNPNFTNVIYLTNTNKGYNYNLSFQLQKKFTGGGLINTSYTYGESKDLFSGTSSQASSNWGYNTTSGNPNDPELSHSSHDTRHRFMFAIAKTFRFIPNAPTTFSLFYTARSGRPYSTIYRYDYNGDGRSNDSIYVPRDENDIILTSGTWAELDAYIKGDPALDSHRGQILPRNASRDPWYHRVDFKIAQEFPVPGMKGHKIVLSFDIENLMNLFDKEAGYYKYIQFDDAPLQFQGYNGDGVPTFSFRGDASSDDARYILNQEFSRWRGMFGIKYKF
ncbi:MAG: TonB-dependent receptor plug domain-containing protein [bacterium]|nr:TonB-dependent receptor plug domain-containing protein [bacterium]